MWFPNRSSGNDSFTKSPVSSDPITASVISFRYIVYAGCVCNLIALCLVGKSYKVKGLTKQLLYSLTFSDISFMVVCVLYMHLPRHHRMSTTFCAFYIVMVQGTVLVSFTTSVALSVQSYLAIFKPMLSRRIGRTKSVYTGVLVGAIWIVIFSVTCLSIYITGVYMARDCLLLAHIPRVALILLSFYCFLCCACICFCNARVAMALRKLGRVRSTGNSQSVPGMRMASTTQQLSQPSESQDSDKTEQVLRESVPAVCLTDAQHSKQRQLPTGVPFSVFVVQEPVLGSGMAPPEQCLNGISSSGSSCPSPSTSSSWAASSSSSNDTRLRMKRRELVGSSGSSGVQLMAFKRSDSLCSPSAPDLRRTLSSKPWPVNSNEVAHSKDTNRHSFPQKTVAIAESTNLTTVSAPCGTQAAGNSLSETESRYRCQDIPQVPTHKRPLDSLPARGRPNSNNAGLSNAQVCRRRKTALTLAMVAISNTLITLPLVILWFLVGTVVTERDKFARSQLSRSITGAVTISALLNPILYAWRLIDWRAVLSKLKQVF